MTIRTYQTGDEVAQVGIYNEAAAELPKFKPATVDEVRRRLRGPDFDPKARFYAVEGNKTVAYATFQNNGRVSLPWCRKGAEKWAEPLFEYVVQAMRGRGLTRAFAAYRADWPGARDFLLAHGFVEAREMLNYLLDLVEMPTPAARTGNSITPLTPDDLPTLLEKAPDVFRLRGAELEKALFQNPYFPPDSLFCLRGRTDNKVLAAGLLVKNAAYANVTQVDASMPCFRLGAFGTEGLTTKRINGLFSFVVTEQRETNQLGLDLLGHAAYLLYDSDVETFAAQVPSDVPNLARFYKQYCRLQGRFPVFERAL